VWQGTAQTVSGKCQDFAAKSTSEQQALTYHQKLQQSMTNLKMNFCIPEKALIQEIEANVERSFDMAAAAFLVGRDAAEEGSHDNCDDENEGEDDANDDEDAVDDGNENNNDIVATSTCPGCEEDSCVFIRHKDSLVACDEAEHGSLAREDAPDNNVRRKKLHRQCTLMINGGPLGAGVWRPLPSCCISATCEMLSSETFIGF
jgi:hypothetical protein